MFIKIYDLSTCALVSLSIDFCVLSLWFSENSELRKPFKLLVLICFIVTLVQEIKFIVNFKFIYHSFVSDRRFLFSALHAPSLWEIVEVRRDFLLSPVRKKRDPTLWFAQIIMT